MAEKRRADFLDIGSDDEGSEAGYNSEDFEESKGRGFNKRSQNKSTDLRSKRRRLSDDESDGSDNERGSDILDTASAIDDVAQARRDGDTSTRASADPAPTDESTASKPISSRKATKKTRKNKTGVIYMSSLPPYLKPSALKSMLVARGFGPITKVFLSPYVPPTSTSRAAIKASRNKRRMYTDGWVEFESKRTAKICAEALNASIVGGKKGGWYHDDVWNMKYLRGFKWTDLMEQVQREKREAEARRRIEDTKARKEEKSFLQGLEQGKIVEGIKKKREAKEQLKADSGNNEEPAQKKMEIRRVFRQNEVRGSSGGSAGDPGSSKKVDSDTQRVLSKIF
ncbi:pre-rRNA-processing protein ESF2 [Nannizzia gypsea CBS 118893]|uniref:Pre-rRNA-processing protein ESF2 n=1 Tax=Arthroderma gypseum (strain ATCC MYA-4604 / CBS 118893) TaxID=535722 RepID=E4V440_ARTGP|nr:pre-rRNA-processing protein ESF2 [Nannizzia gypsea CBS 118893]EFR04764.1 pre-rRNA-processing protein ESF2 [Nannizzia gypsea CBS 118893]